MSIDFAKLAKKIQKAKEKREEEEKQKWKDRMPDKIEVTAEGKITAENAQVESQQVQNQNVSEQQTSEQATGGREGAPAGQQGAGGAAQESVAPPTEQTQEPQETQQERTAVQQGGGSDADTVSLNPDLGGAADWLEESEEEEDEDETNKEDIDKQYPLLPEDVDSVQQAHAWAEITYDPAQEELIYRLHEPDLNDRLQEILDRVEELLKERLDVDFGQLKKEEAKDYLREQVKKILDGHSFNLNQQDRSIIQYYAFRNFVGLDRIEPLMADTEIEDISCDGVGIPIYVYHRDPDIGSVKTNVVFEDEDELDAFVRKLAQRCGRSISMAEPLLDGSLPDGSRVQATLGTDIARRGTNFTIRRFTEEPLTPIHLMEYGSIDAEMLAYLWMAVENGKSILIAGATAAGKTTLLNSLSLFIRPEMKIVSIEDTPELRLPHPNWVPEVAREGFGFGERSTGEVTLDDLLKESLRQRPDFIIVGEVRGEEAYILFQQMATGHPGMSTIHASSLEKIMNRLTTKPIDLPPSLLDNLDLIVFAKRTRRQGSYVRRVANIYEFLEYDKETEDPVVNNVFEWRAADDTFINPTDSTLLSEISEEHGISKKEVQEEIVRRKKILMWMRQRGIKHYQEVGRVISTYYHHPDQIMDRVEAEL